MCAPPPQRLQFVPRLHRTSQAIWIGCKSSWHRALHILLVAFVGGGGGRETVVGDIRARRSSADFLKWDGHVGGRERGERSPWEPGHQARCNIGSRTIQSALAYPIIVTKSHYKSEVCFREFVFAMAPEPSHRQLLHKLLEALRGTTANAVQEEPKERRNVISNR